MEETTAGLAPAFACPGCGERSEGFGRCGSFQCLDTALDGSAHLAPYRHRVLRSLLQAWKYERVDEARYAVREAFGWLAHGLAGAVPEGAIALPVPAHPFRTALRGFDQAHELAQVAVDAWRARVVDDALVRSFRWRSQVASGSSETRRRANARGSVQATRRFPSVTVMLVDDVMTTGATMGECARVLKEAGAGKVFAVTLLKG